MPTPRVISQADLLEFIKENVHYHSERVTMDANLMDNLGMDSLDRIALVMDIEYFMGIEIGESELLTFVTIKDIVEHLRKCGYIKD